MKLREFDHRYTIDDDLGIEFYNVTNLVEDQFPPFEKEKIAKWLVNNTQKYSCYSANELIQEWENIKNEGTAVHTELEQYIRCGKRPTLDKAIWGMEWIRREAYLYGDTFFPEVIVFSKELKLAGTIDLIIYDSKRKTCSIFDWKTSKKIDYNGKKSAITSACRGLTDCRYDQYSLQLSTYSFLLERYHNIKASNQYILHLTEEYTDCIDGKRLDSNVERILEERLK